MEPEPSTPRDSARPWVPPARPRPLQTTKLLVEYDGTNFVGWAKQPQGRSIEAELERSLTTLLGGTTPAYFVGGRTDTGVHAAGQVVAYDHEALDPYSLNAVLPDDIAVLESVPVRPGFDPRNDALSRTYRYRILHRRARSAFLARRSLHWSRPLDLEAMHQCAAALVGKHDFRAFTPTETEHSWFRRSVTQSRWLHEDDLLIYEITADGFLRHMNRTLVGTMLDVGLGMRGVDDFVELLGGADRKAAGWTAPPMGLTLERITYPDEPIGS